MENLDNAEEDEGCDAEVLSSVAAEATLTDKQVACTVHTAYCTIHVVKLHLFGKLIMRSGFGLIGLLWVQQFPSLPPPPPPLFEIMRCTCAHAAGPECC